MVLGFLFLCIVFVYCEVFALPATPRAAWGDAAIYLHNATRMLEGQLIYRDYDHFTLPGTDVLYFALFKVFGVRGWIPDLMLLLTGALVAGLIMTISRRVLTGAAVFLPSLLFLTLPFSSYLDATHHWYSTLAATAALAVIIERRTPGRLGVAGIFAGLAVCFSQSVALVAVGFAAFLLWERRQRSASWHLLLRQEACLLTGFAAALVGFNTYFVWKAGLKQFLACTVVFVAKYYPADRFNTWRVYLRQWPPLHFWANWPDLVAWPILHLVVPLIYIIFFLYARRAQKVHPDEPWEPLMLINFTGLSLFLAIASSPAYNRLYTVSGLALILLVWLAHSAAGTRRLTLRALWTLALTLAMVKPIVMQLRWKAYLDLPTGRTAFFEPNTYEKVRWVSQRTQPGEYFFGDQLICFVLRLRDPARVSFLRPTDYTRPEEVANVVQALEEHQVRLVSWYSGLDARPDRPGNHLGPLVSYLRQHYHVAQVFPNQDEMLERNP